MPPSVSPISSLAIATSYLWSPAAMRKHSTSQLCAKAQKAGICLGVVVGGVSIYLQSLQIYICKKSARPKSPKTSRLKAPSQRSPSHLEKMSKLRPMWHKQSEFRSSCARSWSISLKITPFRSPRWPWVAPKLCTSALSCPETRYYILFIILNSWSWQP